MRISGIRRHRPELGAVLMLICFAAAAPAQNNKLHEATLLSRLGHHEAGLGQSAYNFNLMARSDNWPAIVRSSAVLYYGSMGWNGDSDWFSVSSGGPGLSRIKDLGAKQWTEVVATPFVPVTQHSSDGVRAPRPDQSYEESSEGRVTKIVQGHLYAIHFKNETEDFYIMLRVDELVPSDRCTISWRVVPRPDETWTID